MFLFDKVIDKTPKFSWRSSQYESGTQKSTSDWINDFVASCNWVCAVADEFVNDNFNLHGLSTKFEDYQTIIKVVRGQNYDVDEETAGLQEAAEHLYSLIHARYLLTITGVREMQPKYKMKVFGTCPRVACNGQTLLPIGLSTTPGEMRAKTFCPCCSDVYEADVDVDGAFFGPYFPHLFLQTIRDEKFERLTATPVAFMDVPVDPKSEMNRSKVLHG